MEEVCEKKHNNYNDYLKDSVLQMTQRLKTLPVSSEEHQTIIKYKSYCESIIKGKHLKKFEIERCNTDQMNQDGYDNVYSFKYNLL